MSVATTALQMTLHAVDSVENLLGKKPPSDVN